MMIGICDDEPVFIDLFSRQVRAYMKENYPFRFELRTFTDSADLLENITEIDLLFLDIEMGENDSGIQIKQRISSLQADIRIVFVTSHCEITADAFGKNVYAFLQKKDAEARLPSVLDDVLKDFDSGQLELEDIDGITRSIQPAHIKYIEVRDKFTEVYLKDDTLTFRLPLKEWWTLLPAGKFGMASRYCIVNFSYLCGSLLKWNLTIDGRRIDVPKSRKRTFKEAYQKYMRSSI